MTRERIIERVNALMAARAGIDPGDISPEDFYDELGASSMQCIEVLVDIEREFGIDVPGDRLLNVTTMQDVYDLVEGIIAEVRQYIDSIVNEKQ